MTTFLKHLPALIVALAVLGASSALTALGTLSITEWGTIVGSVVGFVVSGVFTFNAAVAGFAAAPSTPSVAAPAPAKTAAVTPLPSTPQATV